MTLKDYLIRNKLLPTHFAETLGVPASTVTRWLAGERTPSLASMSAITRATRGKVTIADMLRR